MMCWGNPGETAKNEKKSENQGQGRRQNTANSCARGLEEGILEEIGKEQKGGGIRGKGVTSPQILTVLTGGRLAEILGKVLGRKRGAMGPSVGSIV